ncbi:MAG: GNAT N-acetyltransferase [Chloroflexi bacterium]|nr:MAG: GNAT N-acetyltransferase [Chloroflexota bacterium]
MFELHINETTYLSYIEPYHAPALYQLLQQNRDHLAPHVPWAVKVNDIETAREVIRQLRTMFVSGDGLGAFIWHKGQLAGYVGLHIGEQRDTAEIGYWLGEAFTGKGLATLAAEAIASYAFQELGLEKLHIRTKSDNIRSIAIAERLNFSYLETLSSEKGQFKVYQISREQWPSNGDRRAFEHRIDDEMALRLIEERHATMLFHIIDENRAHLRQWMPWLDITRTPADTLDFIQRSLKQYGEFKGMNVGIWYHGQLVGVCGYHEWDFSNRKTSIGYWLSAASTGKGIMTRAARAIVAYALETLDLNRIELRCAVGNDRSCAIAKRLGFTHEGVLRAAEWLYNHFVDHNVYSILQTEWREQTA